MPDPITKAHAAVDYVYSEHRRQIREKNQKINALQAEKGELQRALQERPETPSETLIERAEKAEENVRAREEMVNRLAARAEKAEQERDEARRERDSWRAQVPLADWEKELIQHSEQSRPLAPDAITDEMVERYLNHRDPDEVRDWRLAGYRDDLVEKARAHLVAALTEPTRPEEKVEGVLRRYWSGDIDGTDLAARIVEEMNR